MNGTSDVSGLAENNDVRFAVGAGVPLGPMLLWLLGGIGSSFAAAWLAHLVTGSVDASLGLGVLALAGGFAGAYLAHRKAQTAMVEAEMQRVARLPFPVVGFFETLASSPSSSCQVRVRLRFADDPALPETSLVHDLLGLVKATEVERGETWIEIQSAELDCSQNDGPDTNRAVYGWQAQLVSQVLQPLHEAHPLRRVEISRA
jgi:hypothetical protein